MQDEDRSLQRMSRICPLRRSVLVFHANKDQLESSRSALYLVCVRYVRVVMSITKRAKEAKLHKGIKPIVMIRLGIC